MLKSGSSKINLYFAQKCFEMICTALGWTLSPININLSLTDEEYGITYLHAVNDPVTGLAQNASRFHYRIFMKLYHWRKEIYKIMSS